MKKLYLLIAILIALVCVAGCAVPVLPEPQPTPTYDYVNSLGFFRIERYDSFVTGFSAEERLGREVFFGKIDTLEEAREHAETILIEEYGEELVREQMPFKVNYDEASDTWFVFGIFKEELYLDGGVYIILNGEDGEVLAIWADA